MTVNIKEEKILSFQNTKFGDENQTTLLSSFYDFLEGEKLDNEVRDCELKLMKLLHRKYNN